MRTLEDRMAEQMREQNRRFDSVMLGAEKPPACFTCKAPSTHVTERITPAGYHAWQCAAHAPSKPAPLWGSDPGWQSHYTTIETARTRYCPEHRSLTCGCDARCTLCGKQPPEHPFLYCADCAAYERDEYAALKDER